MHDVFRIAMACMSVCSHLGCRDNSEEIISYSYCCKEATAATARDKKAIDVCSAQEAYNHVCKKAEDACL